MSKLADLIRRTTRAEPERLGFALGQRTTAPSMLLVGLATRNAARSAGDAHSAGADALLLTGRPKKGELAEVVAAAEALPIGLGLEEVDTADLEGFRDAGADFIALEMRTPASALLNKDLGFILRLRDDLTDVQLRTLDALPINAIYVERNRTPLTIERQLELRRISGLTRKPLLLTIPPDATQEHLLSLRESGVALLGFDFDAHDADSLRTLRTLVDQLPKHRARRDESQVSLPTRSASVARGDEEDEEEED